MLAEQARFALNSGVGAPEIRSWDRSLPAFLADMADAGLGDVEVLLEHQLPYSPKRADLILCGAHPRTGAPSFVMVELKQWSHAEPVDEDLVQIDRYTQPVLHPAEQVRRYCQQLVDFTPVLAEQPDAVHGLAYLHNARDAGVWNIRQYRTDDWGSLYTLDSKAALVDRLRARLDPAAGRGPARAAAETLLNAELAPSRKLLAVAAGELRERQQFVLLDEQQVAFATVRAAVERSRTARQQTVVIVVGGPGSGKSVIALSLLGELSRRGLRVLHATGSSAFTNTMRKVAGTRNTAVQKMFVYFNNFIGAKPRSLDVLLCDEAHRLRETSVNRFTPKDRRAAARQQVDELIDVAQVPVFLLDDKQIVRPGEMGSEVAIRHAAQALGCKVETVRLQGQYRSGGSDAYDAWSVRLLGLHPDPPEPWSVSASGDDGRFLVRSAASPVELESWLLHQQSGHDGTTARIAAGYCWPWSDPVLREGRKVLVADVVIGDWARPWNVKPEEKVPDAPASYFWATDTRGFGQVGCIYTAQGFEYDWAGVIFGPDFVRRGDAWVAQLSHCKDPAVRRADGGSFTELIRNTYRVLLTRGMRGVVVYSTDPETQAFLEQMTR
ncbi:nucleotide-binding universal stress UspA family protein [Allocatelliglobosispora scoriae]|uniref:Nucleotide-binding universal stress UspA family protein n=1 Tax=Allocatelliglobosispora scoriae TaxID=643052 RepID=A0A841BMS9_9ACTN|nr:DNA/RNA helicase domain-containing protein [Allocatelliglobosispora scoriae]MBB5868576.1 nucleotide-binding universal stress UspA family protein [Allocatelliglobosispora scoriae]